MCSRILSQTDVIFLHLEFLSVVVLLLFFFSLVFHCLLFHMCLFFIITCALVILIIKTTYLLTYFTFLPSHRISGQFDKRRQWNVRKQALVEFHHHAGVRDISQIWSSECIPLAVGVEIKHRSWALVQPPSDHWEAMCAGIRIIVFIRGAELHPVGKCSCIKCCGKCVAGVTAVSRHTQTVLVSLWTHREWCIFRRGPQSIVFFDLKNTSRLLHSILKDAEKPRHAPYYLAKLLALNFGRDHKPYTSRPCALWLKAIVPQSVSLF